MSLFRERIGPQHMLIIKSIKEGDFPSMKGNYYGTNQGKTR